MMGISPTELLLIAIVALVVIGPKDLPAALRSMGRSVRTIRRMAGSFQSQVDQFVRESEIDTLRREIMDLSKDANRATTMGKGAPTVGAPPQTVRDEPGRSELDGANDKGTVRDSSIRLKPADRA